MLYFDFLDSWKLVFRNLRLYFQNFTVSGRNTPLSERNTPSNPLFERHAVPKIGVKHSILAAIGTIGPLLRHLFSLFNLSYCIDYFEIFLHICVFSIYMDSLSTHMKDITHVKLINFLHAVSIFYIFRQFELWGIIHSLLVLWDEACILIILYTY